MGTPRRLEAAAVSDNGMEGPLTGDPTAFGFFQAVRLLERLRPERAPVGRYADPADEVVRFSAHTTLSFPASEIQALDLRPGGAGQMTVNFMGLTGPTGVLPYHYTQIMSERIRARDRTLRDFLDLFHHRIISLFYRAWEKHHPTVAYERDRQDRVTRHVADLIGLASLERPEGATVPVESFLFYAGLLGPQQRSALALQEMVQDYFGVGAEVEQFVGGWFPLAGSTQCALSDDDSGGASGQLGLGAVVGDEVWDQQARVRIRLGPMPRSQYDRFLPGGEAHQPLRELVRAFGGDSFDFEVQLILARDDVPGTVLGAEDAPPVALGWATWIKTAPRDADADDTTFTL
ncbi:MAG TPA: type VI secretion system baseplate subunit TssG [Gemmatimonadales bacterium]|nr:type VI secretion system baseplate subunit TssG [Gemmatimonadales bacterium]